MNWLLNVDWTGVFAFDVSPLEIFVRGTLMYLGLMLLLRLFHGRQAGSLSLSDMLVVFLLADAAQNGMAGEYQSVPEGILLVATLIFWSYFLGRLEYKYVWFQKLIHPKPLPLIKDGKLIIDNMRRELISREELKSKIREQNIEHLKDVKCAWLEGDGQISIIKYE